MLLTLLALLTGPAQKPPVDQVKIVTSLTTYGAIAREIVGDRGTVTSIAQGDEDPHFVQPKPSFVAVLRDADLFVTTGLDLELWVPALLDRASNRKVMRRRAGIRDGLHRDHPARGAHLAQSLRGRHPRRRQPAHSHRSDQRRSSSARNILTGLTRVDPAERRVLHGSRGGFREAGARRRRSVRSWWGF